ncbi:hypothetical protein K402DRAFT_465986, partial [Aulographum hederae CBS 113979]
AILTELKVPPSHATTFLATWSPLCQFSPLLALSLLIALLPLPQLSPLPQVTPLIAPPTISWATSDSTTC